MLGVMAFGYFVNLVIMYQFNSSPTLALPIYLIVQIVAGAVHMAVSIGWIKICLNVVDGKPASVRDLSEGFSVLLPRFILGILCMIGVALFPFLIAMSVLQAGNYTGNQPLVLVGFFLTVASYVWVIMSMLRYSMYNYILVDKQASTIESFKISAAITRGSRGRLFGLWFLLGCLFFIPLLPVMSYIAYLFRTSAFDGISGVMISFMDAKYNLLALGGFGLVGFVFVSLFAIVAQVCVYRRLEQAHSAQTITTL